MKLMQLEEPIFLVDFNQNVEKIRQKVWHDCIIKLKSFSIVDLVLLYEIRNLKHLGKLQMH